MEIELQYLYTSDDPIMVPAELAGFALAESLSFDIVDTYFDTPELSIRHAGCSLRVRRQSNLPHPVLTWKGPSVRRADGAKQREEVEVPIDHVPADGAGLLEAVHRYRLWELVAEAPGLGASVELASIGELKNRRSSHLYVQGLHRMELTWDRLAYPLGPPEVRLEVEMKRQRTATFLQAVDDDVRRLFGKRIVPAPYGKSKELCMRLYPEAFAPRPAR